MLSTVPWQLGKLHVWVWSPWSIQSKLSHKNQTWKNKKIRIHIQRLHSSLPSNIIWLTHMNHWSLQNPSHTVTGTFSVLQSSFELVWVGETNGLLLKYNCLLSQVAPHKDLICWVCEEIILSLYWCWSQSTVWVSLQSVSLATRVSLMGLELVISMCYPSSTAFPSPFISVSLFFC